MDRELLARECLLKIDRTCVFQTTQPEFRSRVTETEMSRHFLLTPASHQLQRNLAQSLHTRPPLDHAPQTSRGSHVGFRYTQAMASDACAH